MREAPAGAPGPAAPGALPALAGGSSELDEEPPGVTAARFPQPEVLLVALIAGAATIFFGVIPQPLFNLVGNLAGALGLK
jgi:hypothetical protein